MTQVSTQEELRAALLAREAEIQVIADFDIRVQQNVTYSLLLHSAPNSTVHTLSKTAGFSGSLLRVSGGGALTLENLILDGSAAGSYLENDANRTLVQVAGGRIHLASGAVLQNNSSFQEGGGLYLSGDASYVNTLLMDGDAVIRGCNSRTSGGGLTVALRNNGDRVRLAGTALIEQNTAANGAGVYLRSYLAEAGGALFIGEQVQIRNNRASSNGGGIYCSSFSTGGSASLSLTVEGELDIASNQAASGGGIYFYSANPGDRLTLAGPIRITENTVTGSGGGIYLSAPRDSVSLSIQGASITDNQASNGGGIYLRATAGGSLEVSGQAILSGNVAAGATSSAGGGLWIQNVSGTLAVALSNVSLLSNRAAGNGGGIYAFHSDNCVMELKDCTLTGNVGNQGGGLYFSRGSSGEGTLLMDSVTMSENTGRNGGGAIFLGNGRVRTDLNQVILSGNVAPGGAGGGLYSAGGTGQISIRGDSRILENRATSGGGIYHSGDRVLALYRVHFLQNTAATGLDIYNAGPLELHPVENPAEEPGVMANIQDGLYLVNEDAVPTLLDHLTAGSIVQLERSDYVAPNQAGTPIVVALSVPSLSTEDAFVFRKPATGFDGWEIRIGDNESAILLAPVEYALQYENTQGAENPNPIRYTEYTPTVTLLPLSNRPGYRFLGWFDASEGGTQVTEIPTGSTGNKTLYARWQAVYTVTYYGNDAGGPAAENLPQSQQVPEGESVLLSDERPTRTGYVFTGWNTQPDGSGTAYQPGVSFGPATADANLYAQWGLLPPTLHLLTYEPNDVGGASAEQIPEQEEIVEGDTAELSTTIPTRLGYRFLGWNAAPDGTGTAYQPGETVGPFYADLTLHAQWQQVEHTLTYHGNDEAGPPAQWIPFPQPVPEGQVISLPNVSPTREGFTFTGWNTQADGGGTAYQPGGPFGPMDADADLYAQWAVIPPSAHTLTYYGNDAGGPPACCIPCPQSIPVEQYAGIPYCAPYRTGYCFTGWNTEPCGRGQTVCPGQAIGPVMGDVCLYAQWRRLPPPKPCYLCRSEPDG